MKSIEIKKIVRESYGKIAKEQKGCGCGTGGRIAISDIALKKKLPRKIQKNMEAYVGCVGGAVLVEDYKKIVVAAGFKNVKITVKGTSACIDPDTKDPIGRAILDNLKEDESLDDYVVSVYVEGRK